MRRRPCRRKFSLANEGLAQYLIRRSNTQLNTSQKSEICKNPTSIQVIDPRHPLYGKSFTLMSIECTSRRSYAVVHYRDSLVLRIPLSATDQSGNHFPRSAKLSAQVLKDLAALTNDDEILCQISQKISGADCVPKPNEVLSNHLS